MYPLYSQRKFHTCLGEFRYAFKWRLGVKSLNEGHNSYTGLRDFSESSAGCPDGVQGWSHG